MSKINFEDIQENYETALTEKENNTEDVVSAIIDNDLTAKFVSIQKDKEKINTLEDLSKYQKNLKLFFNEVYSIITAPGVQKFVDWLDELSSKGLETKTRKLLTDFLIREYASYDNIITNIIANKSVVDANSSLFENIRKSIKENINKRIISSFTAKEKFEEDLPDFIDELNDLLDGLSEIEELRFGVVKDFYTANLDEKDDDNYNPDIDNDAEYYSELIKQVVERKDSLTTDKDKIQISTIVEIVQNSISDINKSIETIKSIGVSTTSDENITFLYNKFEMSFNFNNVENISDFIQESIDETWNKIMDACNVSQVFYSEYTSAKVEKLEENKKKWKNFSFSEEIEQFVLTIKNIISKSPLNSINDSDLSKIKTSFTKVEKSIKSLEDNNPKDAIVSYFSNITSDYEDKKIEILKKLKIDSDTISKIERDITAINDYIETINNADNLLDALNEDFVDGILGSYDYIKKEFTAAIEQSDIKNDLGYLYEISSDGYVLSKSDLETNLERFKRLLEYDLININLTKNI